METTNERRGGVLVPESGLEVYVMDSTTLSRDRGREGREGDVTTIVLERFSFRLINQLLEIFKRGRCLKCLIPGLRSRIVCSGSRDLMLR